MDKEKSGGHSPWARGMSANRVRSETGEKRKNEKKPS
jgi:hypothetical protein